MSSESPLVRVELEFADGSIQRLTGPPAEAWLEDVNNVVTAAAIRYSRSQMDVYPWEHVSAAAKRELPADKFADYEGMD